MEVKGNEATDHLYRLSTSYPKSSFARGSEWPMDSSIDFGCLPSKAIIKQCGCASGLVVRYPMLSHSNCLWGHPQGCSRGHQPTFFQVTILFCVKNKNIKESMINLQKCPIGLHATLNKLSNELFYTKNRATSQKIWWFHQTLSSFQNQFLRWYHLRCVIIFTMVLQN